MDFENWTRCVPGPTVVYIVNLTEECNNTILLSSAEPDIAGTTQDKGADIFLLVLLCPLTLVCLSGNGLVIAALVCFKSLRVPQNYFLFSLALSDLCNGLVFPVYVTSHTQFTGIREHLGTWKVCDSVLVTLVAVQMASSYNLVTITAGRYVAVKYPIKHRKYLDRKRALVIAFTIWIVSIITAVCIYARSGFDTYQGVCRYELFLTVRHTSALLVFTVLLPLLIMTCFYALIQHEFRKNTAIFQKGQLKINGSLKSRHIYHEHRLVKMATFLLSYFAISWLPFVIYTYVAMLCHCSINAYIRDSFRLLYFSNSAINVLVYAGRHPDFRHAFRRMFLRLTRWRCENEHTTLEMSLSTGAHNPNTPC